MTALRWELTPDRLWAMLELERDLFVVLAPDFRVLYASPSAERALGYSPSELLGEPGLAFVYPDDVPPVEVVFRSLLQEPVQRGDQLAGYP